jgi:hypothetical protein
MSPVAPPLLWWHWVAFGLVLVAAELLVPSFTIVGSSRPAVGGRLLAAPCRGSGSLFFRLEDGRPHHLGMSREAIVGQSGCCSLQLDRSRIRLWSPSRGREPRRAGDYARP